MHNEPLNVVVGTEDFVCGGFAKGLQSEKVISCALRNGNGPISQAEGLIRRADVIINAIWIPNTMPGGRRAECWGSVPALFSGENLATHHPAGVAVETRKRCGPAGGRQAEATCPTHRQ